MTHSRKLRVFLCHASQDKPIVRELYQRLNAEGWIDPWLDEEKLLPGQDWELEIRKAIQNSDVIIACFSAQSASNKKGYIQKEIQFSIDVALEKAKDPISIIPTRLEECSIPAILSNWQSVDLFLNNGYQWLMKGMEMYSDGIVKVPSNDIEEKIDLSKLGTSRPLRVFICYASSDKPVVRIFYKRLYKEGWIDAWFDEEKLFPGQNWDLEIEKAVEVADAIIVCLSNNSITKEGYVQKELRFVLEVALEKPEEMVFIIPLRLDDCPIPRRLRAIQYVDYYPSSRLDWAYSRILTSLEIRANNLGL